MKKVLVTGHRGYIGPHLVNLLKECGAYVTGCDLNLFEGCEFYPMTLPDNELERDFRTLTTQDLEGYDCIMHLAGLSNDPMGDLKPELTKNVNGQGTIQLAKEAKKAGISTFLFASSCSIYGKGVKLDLSEEDPLLPLTPYAQSKIEAEKEILKLADDHYTVASLRNATAYGDSPMLRIDLVVNNLLACAMTRGDIRVMSDGTPWRPLVHCHDIARAFIAFWEAPIATINGQAVNIGANEENYQVRDVIDYVKRLVPKASVVFTGEVGADPRNYRVSFDRLGKLIPNFKLAYTLESGMEELFSQYKRYNFSLEDFMGDRYIRLKTLKKCLEKVECAAV